MSKIRNLVLAALVSVAGTAGVVASPAPQAEAVAGTCATSPHVRCSIWWANRISVPQLSATKSSYSAKAVQQALRNVGFNVKVTGFYDRQTVQNVALYQRTRKLPISGSMYNHTLYALRVGAGAKVALPVNKPQVAVNFAHQQIGKPYGYGAIGPSAYDCSGLVYASYKKAGITLPRTSYAQLSKYRTVSKSSLRPGDIVSYNGGGHVGIYVGNGQIVHSSRPGVPIKKVPLNYMRYYKAVRPVG